MNEQVFELKHDFIPLIGLLKTMGIAATGGHAGILVTEGEVKVNGAIELQKRKKLKEGDIVTLAGHKISLVSSSKQ